MLNHDAYGMVQYKNEMMQCRQVLVTWTRMHYIGKSHQKGLAQTVNRQGSKQEVSR
jgi:hypothetical protein